MNEHEHLDLELVDLLGGDLDPTRRTELTEELRRCEVCAQRYDELAAALADAVTATPAVTPPLGFETRVIERLGVPAAERRPSAPADRRRRRPTRRRWWPAAVAAAAVLLVAGAGFTLGRTGRTDDVAALTLRQTATGEAVGTVSFAETGGGDPVMVVALFDAPAGVAYRCRMRLADGTVVDSSAWPPMERGAWVVDVPGDVDDIDTVEIVADGSDRVWSSASP